MPSRLPSHASSAAGLVSLLALAVMTVGVSACARHPAYEGPELTSFEKQQHERCVSLLRSAWQGAPVRFTSAERGASGLDYVWVNVDVDDDHDDIARRSAKGSRHAGHCQFDHGGGDVHVHSYALTTTAADAAVQVDSGYRYFTASAQATDGVAVGQATTSTQ